VNLKSTLLCGVSVLALMATPAAAQQISDFAFQVNQSAGSVATTTPSAPATAVTLQAGNILEGLTSSSLLSTATVGGSQSALNTLNSASLLPMAGTEGTISQTAFSPLIETKNTIRSSTTAGPTSVDGQGGLQSAGSILNSASAAIPTVGGSLQISALNQVAKSPNITSTNSAVAEVTGAIVDPSVRNLGQVASINLNSMSFSDGSTISSGGVISPATANVTIGGEQKLQPQTTTASSFTIANKALADAITAPAAGGPVSVTNVAQGGALNINTVSGGPGTNLTASLLSQSAADDQVVVAGTGVTASSTAGALAYGGVFGTPVTAPTPSSPAIVNSMQAATNSGSATVTGPTGVLTQSFAGKVNSVSTGGNISGDITQSAGTQTVGLVNLAEAHTGAGRALVSGVSQSLGQSFNTVQAGGSVAGLTLSQTAADLTIATANVQSAQGSNNAQILGGSQQSVNSVNVVK